MPAIPPIAVQTIEDIENIPAPQSEGMNPPSKEPATIPAQIIDLEFINYFCDLF